ncbi:MAG: hypothetical protein IKR21_00050, partial [Oscillospiraceae bacterium]|nr:hypothetical protein [Oscillospiraceae bacterium]
MAKHKKKGFSIIRAVISLLVLAIVVCFAYIAVKCGGDLSWDNIERTVKNLRAGVRSAETFEFGSSDGAVFADAGGSLVKLTNGRVTEYSAAGSETYTEKLRAARPAVHSMAGRAVAYGAGDNDVRVFDSSGLMYSLETEGEIVSATMSADGKMALCAREEGWNGAVTVYNTAGQAIYKWYCATGYPSVAAVSRDGRNMAVLTLGSAGCDIVYLRLDKETEQGRLPLGEELALDIRFLSNGSLTIITENEAITTSSTGEMTSNYLFGGKTLLAYDLGSDEMTLLVLEDFPGGQCEVMTLSSSCQVLGSVTAENPVVSVS